MRRTGHYILLFIVALGLTVPIISFSASSEANQAIQDANLFFKEKMGLEGYYESSSKGKEINYSLAARGTDAFEGKPIFVYGSTHEASINATTGGSSGRYFDTINGKVEFRALGYAINGSPFPNPVFTPENEGSLADDKKWVKQPWGDSGKRDLQGQDGKMYQRYMSTNIYGGLDYINKWIESSVYRFSPNAVASLV
jgi:opacity protein-like surface antigen